MNETTQTVVVEKPYEVSVVEVTQELHEGSGTLEKVGCKWLCNCRPVIAVSTAAARSKVERSLTKECKDDAAADALIDRMKVKVVLVENFS